VKVTQRAISVCKMLAIFFMRMGALLHKSSTTPMLPTLADNLPKTQPSYSIDSVEAPPIAPYEAQT
jgi:hypothetical protein